MSVIKTGINFYQIVFGLFSNKTFITLTILGNATIVILSSICLSFEINTNSDMDSFMEAIWWGYATATTVGYGDIIPVTLAGKLVGILLMLVGTSLFATFTALFAKTILEDEFFNLSTRRAKKPKEVLLEDLEVQRKLIDHQIETLKKN